MFSSRLVLTGRACAFLTVKLTQQIVRCSSPSKYTDLLDCPNLDNEAKEILAALSGPRG